MNIGDIIIHPMSILDSVQIKAKSEIMAEEDEKVFHAIRLAGCPEGCLLVEEEV